MLDTSKRMAKKNFRYCKLGCHDNTSHTVPAMTSPVLLTEEAQHLVYVFCDRGNSTQSHKHRYQRRYCSLCRHFHQENDYKDGFEKYFRRETETSSKRNYRSGKKEQEKLDWSSEGNASGFTANTSVSEEGNWKALFVEGLKMYTISGKYSEKSLPIKPAFWKEGNLHGKEESDEKTFSTQSGCKVCSRRLDSQEDNRSKKKIIKIVVPPFE